MRHPPKKHRLCSIQARMLLFFLIVFLGVALLVLLPWGLYVQRAAERDTSALARQRLAGLDAGVGMALENRSRVCDILLLNRSFEQQTSPKAGELNKNRMLKDTLTRILVSDLDLISAVYFDSGGGSLLMASSSHLYRIHPQALSSPLFTNRLEEAENEMTYLYCGGGALEMTGRVEPYLSFVREINSISDFRRLGVVMLNMTSKRFGEIVYSQMGGDLTQVYVCDGEGRVIARTPNASRSDASLARYQSDAREAQIAREGGARFVVCRQKASLADLTYLSFTPLENGTNLSDNYPLLLVFVALLAAFLILIGEVYMSRSIGGPIARMCEHMRLAEQGEFKPIPIRREKAGDEFTQLQVFFNRMIRAVDALVVRVAEKEKLKRKHEIALLQEQIKPHFLYNALDAISALSLMEDNQTAYTLTQALGAFYRSCLSGGQEMVTVKAEMECIKNYVTVLNIRYENKIHMTYRVPRELEEVELLKLTLQPLVENAVYHGIRQKKGAGRIVLSAAREGKALVFRVEDDGAGMSAARIEEVLSKRSLARGRGFGLYSLAEKLELFYNAADLLKMESSPGAGTRVTLCLPLPEAENKTEKCAEGEQ